MHPTTCTSYLVGAYVGMWEELEVDTYMYLKVPIQGRGRHQIYSIADEYLPT